MTPEIDHIYECTWVEGATFAYLNLVTNVGTYRISGRCLSHGSNFNNATSTWISPTSTITLVGHKDDFPELLL